ncbi:hypothetical protein CULCOIPH002_08710 [Corynebacterium ulcerans]|uniref:Alpha-L-arabinofuranosidase B arabinose-binding domain-containing protein n=2 Tax=Corynebacterium ulcerans TaxID=65058 RepID=A0ABD0BF11_CORUL|nr:AbfB domain-containing protein [Corynebacterium ulcerans]BAM26467.1 putative secreted protein [Corynebacterium ulcerans 0102]KPH78275.1 hypothetical protein AFK72_01310 [Corynebacterium ulcerans]MBH5295210.1 AbfB domain-containing protein [Corynebacterium ulcerans]MBH5301673.1 AbfB domain-containing protein [Corynebacterium ulcerans]MBL4944290.1 AbfB domain-containing protein [Corynebacterium ulcerans]
MIRKLKRAIFPVVAAMVIWCTPIGTAGAIDSNGIEEQPCAFGAKQVRVDTSYSTGPKCFGFVNSSGARVVSVSDAYGVFNRTEFPAKVTFKLPHGQVYWQEIIPAGGLKTLDVERARSEVVEIQYGEVSGLYRKGDGNLFPGSAVSLRISRPHTLLGDVLRFTDELVVGGIGLDSISLDSPFADRLDASFIVRSGLNDSSCISLEVAGYPGVYLVSEKGSVNKRFAPPPDAATWCVSQNENGQSQLKPKNDASKAMGVTLDGRISLVTPGKRFLGPWADSWIVDPALAVPVGMSD